MTMIKLSHQFCPMISLLFI